MGFSRQEYWSGVPCPVRGTRLGKVHKHCSSADWASEWPQPLRKYNFRNFTCSSGVLKLGVKPRAGWGSEDAIGKMGSMDFTWSSKPQSTGSDHNIIDYSILGAVFSGFLVILKNPFRRRQWHPTPVLLPGKSHGRRRLEGYSPWGSMRSLRVGHDWVTSLSLLCIGEGKGNPLQGSCLENSRDGGAWWAAVYGVAQSRTRLKWLSSSSSKEPIQTAVHIFFSIIVVYWQFTWCQGKDQKEVLVNFHPLPDFAQAFVFYKWSPLNLWPFPMPCLLKVSMSQWHRLGNLERERTTERAGPEFFQSGLWIFSPERDSMGKKDIWHNIFARNSLLSPL